MKYLFRKILFLPLIALAMSGRCIAQQSKAAMTLPALVAHSELHSFFSKALQRSMPYEVLLPEGYADSDQRYPVLYLLHGWQGDETNYLKLTSLAHTVAKYPLIVVMPRGNNSWYVNSSTVPADRYADYIFCDLTAEIDKEFRTIASPQGRAIAGLSMGGYGAMLFSLQHPGAFSFVASLSGAFAGPSGIENVIPALKPSTDAAFGPLENETRKKDSIDLLLASDDPASQPYFYLACGSADPLLPSNRHVVQELSAGKFAYEYHELPGAHTWSFWNSQLEPMLAVLAREMHLAPVASDAKPSPVAPIP